MTAALESRPVGVTNALKALAAEFEPKLRSLGALVDKAKKHCQDTRAKLTAREIKHSATADEAVRHAFAEHRAIQRFEALAPAQRREAIRLAIDKRDANFRSAILNEPALLDDATARRIEVSLMATADKALFQQFEELGGKLNAHGEVEKGYESPLLVASFVLDDTREWLDEQVGGGGLDARSILGRAAIDLAGPALMLTPEQGHDPQVYRAAKEVALADKKVLNIGGANAFVDLLIGHNTSK